MSSLNAVGKHSKLWKVWRRAGQGRGDLFFLEHREAVIESLQSQYQPCQVLLGTELYREAPEYWESLAEGSKAAWYRVESEELDKVLSVKGSNGLCGVFRPFEWSLEQALEKRVVLVAWQIQDPGNLGTLVRSVTGLADGAVICVGGCRPWSSKVARASAGALLRAPLVHLSLEQGESTLEKMGARGFALFSAVPRGGESVRRAVWTGRDAILVGNETHGLPQQVVEKSRTLTLEMRSDTESLNAGVAASIIIYERSVNCDFHG